MRARIVNAIEAEKTLLDPDKGYVRHKEYYNYLNAYQGHIPSHSRTQTLNVLGVNVGIACLDTAWRCADDDDEKTLFLTQEQVFHCVEALSSCDLKIALFHHPLAWLHPSEHDEVVPMLKKHFDILCRGHLHMAASLGETTPSSEYLEFAVPALCDGRSPYCGYNIYEIDLDARTLSAKYRKYIASRGEFDRDTDHARDGEHTFNLPAGDIVRRSRSEFGRRIAQLSKDLEAEVQNSLCRVQSNSKPIFVRPSISKTTVASAIKRKQKVQDVVSISSQCAIIYGPPKSGKTVLQQSMASDLNKKAALDQSDLCAVYVDMEKITGTKVSEFVRQSINKLADEALEQIPEATVFLDNPPSHCVDLLNELLELQETQPRWRFVVSMNNYLLFEILMADPNFSDWGFYTVDAWGPSRIREFTLEYFSDEQMDIQTAFEFVSNSLKDTDLPATPIIVSLYLSVFKAIGNHVSSLSFVGMLEKNEAALLGEEPNSAANSLYNKQRILGILATDCARRGRKHIGRDQLNNIVRDYYKAKLLPYVEGSFVKEMLDVGILEEVGDEYGFRLYVYFDYYLARAFKDGTAKVDEFSGTVFDCIKVATALAIYAGLVREDLTTARRFIGLLETTIQPDGKFGLTELDASIRDLLLPYDSGSSEQIANAAIAAVIDYEQMYDDDFDKEKDQYGPERVARIDESTEETPLGKLDRMLSSLKMFYNVFRNLENLDGKEKIELLSRVLDLHVYCNRRLIEHFQGRMDDEGLQTLFSYLLTIGGQIFLSANVGNQSLQQTILATLRASDNDFKELLLVFLYSDLRLPGYTKMLEDLTDKTKSRVAIELIYLKVQNLMVIYDNPTIPVALIAAFKKVHDKRSLLHKGSTSQGVINNTYNKALEATRRAHMVQNQSGE